MASRSSTSSRESPIASGGCCARSSERSGANVLVSAHDADAVLRRGEVPRGGACAVAQGRDVRRLPRQAARSAARCAVPLLSHEASGGPMTPRRIAQSVHSGPSARTRAREARSGRRSGSIWKESPSGEREQISGVASVSRPDLGEFGNNSPTSDRSVIPSRHGRRSSNRKSVIKPQTGHKTAPGFRARSCASRRCVDGSLTATSSGTIVSSFPPPLCVPWPGCERGGVTAWCEGPQPFDLEGFCGLEDAGA